MSFRRWLSLSLVLVAPAALGGQEPPRPVAAPTVELDKAAIDKTRDQDAAAWTAGSAERVAALYAEDAVVLYPNQIAVVGKAAILAYFRGFYDQYAQESFVLNSDEIRIAGKWAFDRGTYRLAMSPRGGGPRIEDQGKYLVILERQGDGSWKVARDMDNTNRPLPQPGP
jgi:uncharacterized protein (TIGR02246 family)